MYVCSQGIPKDHVNVTFRISMILGSELQGPKGPRRWERGLGPCTVPAVSSRRDPRGAAGPQEALWAGPAEALPRCAHGACVPWTSLMAL